jgi:hypothetical protein
MRRTKSGFALKGDPPKRISCLDELSHAGFHSADSHEGGWDASEQSEEKDHKGRILKAHAVAQSRQQAGGDPRKRSVHRVVCKSKTVYGLEGL